MPKRRPSPAKNRTKPASTAITASAVLEMVRSSGPVVSWAQLRHQFDDLKRLRNVLRGLVRNGELDQDELGNYLVGDADRELLRGLVAKGVGRSLVIDSVPIARPDGASKNQPRTPLRPGDTVDYWVADGVAHVSGITDYSSSPIVGVLQSSRYGGFVASLSPDFRGNVNLDEMPSGMSVGDTVSVRVTGADRYGLRGDVTAQVSRSDVADAAAVTLLASHQVPQDWPAEVLEKAAKLPTSVNVKRYSNREDLRSMALVTIDGSDARDFDDAVYCEPRPRGGFRLVVAIADVAEYVKPRSQLGAEAYKRGNSVYLPDRVIPMLPEAISNGLCSLRPDEPRLALVCDMQISKGGKVTSSTFYEALICSWARLTYDQVNNYYLDKEALEFSSPRAEKGRAEIEGNLTQLRRMFAAMSKAREARGALEFETRDGRIVLADGKVQGVVPVTRHDAHKLIEEAMIAANVCAARFIAEHEAKALYRVHEPPPLEKQDVLRDALAYVGVRTKTVPSDPKVLAELLAPLAGREDAWLLYSLILRAMSQACYQGDNRGHFGLALTEYMHFTSPIRRYPDLIVHRVIKALLNDKRLPLQAGDQLAEAGEHLSFTERRAEDVERGVSSWLKCDFVADRIGDDLPGTVVGVAEFGLFVELDGYFVQGLVHVSALGEDYFNFVPASLSLVGERSGRRFGLGDRLQVTLQDAQPALGKLDLVLTANSETKSKQSGASKAGRSKRRSRRR